MSFLYISCADSNGKIVPGTGYMGKAVLVNSSRDKVIEFTVKCISVRTEITESFDGEEIRKETESSYTETYKLNPGEEESLGVTYEAFNYGGGKRVETKREYAIVGELTF